MLKPQLDAKASFFFLRHGLTVALFLWMQFKLDARRFFGSGQSQSPARRADTELSSIEAWIEQHLESRPSLMVLPFLWLVVFIFGAGAMTSILAFGQYELINIWVPLLLFAFLPFLSALVTFAFYLLGRFSNPLKPSIFLSAFTRLLRLKRFRLDSILMSKWALLQIQWLSVWFLVAALLGFFLVASLQEIQFVWSSTLMEDASWVASVMGFISAPWQWLTGFSVPELVAQSRLQGGEIAPNVELGTRWWATITLAITVYGLVPRLFLGVFFYLRLKAAIQRDIDKAVEIDMFHNVARQQTTESPLEISRTDEPLEWLDWAQTGVMLVGWQWTQEDDRLTNNLGVGDWQADVDWLSSLTPNSKSKGYIVVHLMQTPTGELADCLPMLAKAVEQLGLVVLDSEAAEAREESQLRSWQFFAQQNQVPLFRGRL